MNSLNLPPKSWMVNEDNVHTYFKHFLVLCKPLLQNQKIMDKECNTMFWGGFHSELMYPWLIGNNPHHPKGQAFNYEEVLQSAHAKFVNGHFAALTMEDDWEPSFINKPSKPDPIFQKLFNLGVQHSRVSDNDVHRCNCGHNSAFADPQPREETPC